MSSYVDQLDVFQAMLAATPAFVAALPTGVDPNDRIKWLSNFDEFIGNELDRPFALIDSESFGAGRDTEGDADVALVRAGMVCCLSRDAADFDSDDDQFVYREFCKWWSDIFDYLVNWNDTSVSFLRFSQSSNAEKAWRTPVQKREARDDFLKVELNLNIDVGDGS